MVKSSGTVAYDVSPGGELAKKSAAKRDKLAALKRDGKAVAPNKTVYTAGDKSDTAALDKWDSLIKRQGEERRRKEEERLAKVAAFTDNELAKLTTKSDDDVMELLIASLTLRDREGNPEFRKHYERCKDAARDEIKWRLKVYRAAAMGHPKPVRVTKERPVYGKDVDARPAKGDAKPPKKAAKAFLAARSKVLASKPDKAARKPVKSAKR